MGSFIVPNQKQNSHTFLRLVFEQIPQTQLTTTRQRPSWFSNQFHLMENGPTDYVNQVVRLQYRVTYIFPTPIVLKNLPAVQLYLRQQRLRHVRVLVERDRPAFPNREVRVSDSEIVRIGRDADPVYRSVLAFCEPHFE